MVIDKNGNQTKKTSRSPTDVVLIAFSRKQDKGDIEITNRCGIDYVQ